MRNIKNGNKYGFVKNSGSYNKKDSFIKKDSFKKDFHKRNYDNKKIFEKSNKDEKEPEQLYLKGRHEVMQALESGQNLDVIYISSGVRGPIVSEIKTLASASSVVMKEMSSELFEKKFGEKTQGIAALTAAFNYSSLEGLISKAENGHKVIVALNQVEDPRNLGAIVRTAECMGCDGIIIPKHRSASMTEWAIRTAQGAASWLSVARVNNISDAIEELKKLGYWATGLDGSSEKQLKNVNFADSKVVLVAGGEDAGLGDRLKKVCDNLVMIPMSGKTASLNVSVSVAMALYEITRQRNFFN